MGYDVGKRWYRERDCTFFSFTMVKKRGQKDGEMPAKKLSKLESDMEGGRRKVKKPMRLVYVKSGKQEAGPSSDSESTEVLFFCMV